MSKIIYQKIIQLFLILKKVRDAVLVDAINYLGSRGGCDFTLYTKDLYDSKRDEKEVDEEIYAMTYAYAKLNSGAELQVYE